MLAWNEETGEVAPKAVTALIRPEPRELYELTLADTGGAAETFSVTDDHPWMVEGEGWVETIALRPGLRIDTSTDEWLTVAELAFTGEIAQTYNLEVEGWHTFLVGDDQAVVHNLGWCRGTFQSIRNSIIYHFNKHGARAGASSPSAYVRQARDFWRANQGTLSSSGLRPDGSIRFYNGTHFIIMRNGQIVSYGVR